MIPTLDISPIQTDRLVLRGFEPRDYPVYEAYYTDSARTRGVGGPRPKHEVFERFCAMIGHWAVRGFGRYAITTGDTAFGHVGPMQLSEDNTPEMTWTLWDIAKTGQGLATEASRAVLTAFFAKGWKSIPAYIAPDNRASINVALRLGAIEDKETQPPTYVANTRRFVLSAKGLL